MVNSPSNISNHAFSSYYTPLFQYSHILKSNTRYTNNLQTATKSVVPTTQTSILLPFAKKHVNIPFGISGKFASFSEYTHKKESV
jgi:hypothetical protein